MNKQLILTGMLLLFSLTFVSAVCTLTLDKTLYNQGDTATVTAICTENPAEKNIAYTINWTNSSGQQIQIDTGTTPSVISTNFFETFIIPLDYVATNGTVLNVNMTGTGLEGTDTATVQSATSSSLILGDFKITSTILVGRLVGIEFDVKDENDKKIDNAKCRMEVLDSDGNPANVIPPDFSVDGEVAFYTIVSSKGLNEGSEYTLSVHCGCGIANTSIGCVDEDGLAISASFGSSQFPFSVNTWLNVNTVTDRSEYIMKNEITICANLTNVIFDKRIPIEIFHQVRCSAGVDNNADLDRTLIIFDNGEPDERGISVGTTQMQCKKFQIPESKYLQGMSSQCYASTTVWVLNAERDKIMSYSTTSPVFNITSTELNINPDWQRQSPYIWNSIINLSTNNFIDFNGVGTGDIDLKLDMITQSIKASEQYGTKSVNIQDFIMTQYVKTITAKNSSGDDITYNFEVLDDGSIEIELKSVDISSTGYANVTLEFNQWYERDSDSLEGLNLSNYDQAAYLGGINGSAGTFDFSINVPNTVKGTVLVSGEGLTGDGRTLDRDLTIKCQVEGYNETLTEFEVFATDTFAFTKTLDIPYQNGVYTMRCTAIDNFFGEDAVQATDNFRVRVAGPTKFLDTAGKFIKDYFFLFLLILLGCGVFIISKKEDKHKTFK